MTRVFFAKTPLNLLEEDQDSKIYYGVTNIDTLSQAPGDIVWRNTTRKRNRMRPTQDNDWLENPLSVQKTLGDEGFINMPYNS